MTLEHVQSERYKGSLHPSSSLHCGPSVDAPSWHAGAGSQSLWRKCIMIRELESHFIGLRVCRETGRVCLGPFASLGDPVDVCVWVCFSVCVYMCAYICARVCVEMTLSELGLALIWGGSLVNGFGLLARFCKRSLLSRRRYGGRTRFFRAPTDELALAFIF